MGVGRLPAAVTRPPSVHGTPGTRKGSATCGRPPCGSKTGARYHGGVIPTLTSGRALAQWQGPHDRPNGGATRRSTHDVERTAAQEVSAMTAIVTWGTELTILDRCDRCGVNARVRVVLPSGMDLLFCGHHGRHFEKQFFEVAAFVEWCA
jgi:hypothetical protein